MRPMVAAQDEDDFKMPCPEVLKLSLGDFTDVYSDKTEDHSERAEDLAAEYYAGCEAELNTPRLKALERELELAQQRLRDARLGAKPRENAQ